MALEHHEYTGINATDRPDRRCRHLCHFKDKNPLNLKALTGNIDGRRRHLKVAFVAFASAWTAPLNWDIWKSYSSLERRGLMGKRRSLEEKLAALARVEAG
ncbi:hypothetical protein, partial [Oleisolibacter albus]|uniref:hypothetical protein n=1 Tax=Oleisolibacter albus TaxID=2171757 RepID=UPI00196081FD